MKVYQLRSNSDDYKWLDTDSERNPLPYNGESILNKWFELNVWDSKQKRKKSDSPGFYIGIQVVNDKAMAVLNDLVKNDVEFLPLKHNNCKYWLMNVLNVIDAIDYSKSTPFYGIVGNPSHFKEYAFKEEVLKGCHIFKIPEIKNERIFVLDTFKNVVENAKLKGFEFDEVWNSKKDTFYFYT